MKKPKLKPCPFCGREPYLDYDNEYGWLVGCENTYCGAEGMNLMSELAWNDRPIEDYLNKKIQYLTDDSPLRLLGDWIPCSERMPEVSDRYLVVNFSKVDNVATYTAVRTLGLDHKTWDGDPSVITLYWMPIPKEPIVD